MGPRRSGEHGADGDGGGEERDRERQHRARRKEPLLDEAASAREGAHELRVERVVSRTVIEVVVRDVGAEMYEDDSGEREREEQRIECARSRVRDRRPEKNGHDARGEKFRPQLLEEYRRFDHGADYTASAAWTANKMGSREESQRKSRMAAPARNKKAEISISAFMLHAPMILFAGLSSADTPNALAPHRLAPDTLAEKEHRDYEAHVCEVEHLEPPFCFSPLPLD